MSKTYHVYSKMAAPVKYHKYVKDGGGSMTTIAKSVEIKGGAGVANKNIITPLGVHTEITAEEKELLESHGIFQKHAEAGFVVIEERKEDPDRVATNLTDGPDPSAPLTPADFEGVNDEQVAVPETVKATRRRRSK